MFQYLRFGFPSSIESDNTLQNGEVKNHYSALQYPEVVTRYLDKERTLGTILGAVSNSDKPLIHCSSLLTRPKDTDKRRVILDLSFPPGQSVNDLVNKQRFDGCKFTLKFPSRPHC